MSIHTFSRRLRQILFLVPFTMLKDAMYQVPYIPKAQEDMLAFYADVQQRFSVNVRSLRTCHLLYPVRLRTRQQCSSETLETNRI